MTNISFNIIDVLSVPKHLLIFFYMNTLQCMYNMPVKRTIQQTVTNNAIIHLWSQQIYNTNVTVGAWNHCIVQKCCFFDYFLNVANPETFKCFSSRFSLAALLVIRLLHQYVSVYSVMHRHVRFPLLGGRVGVSAKQSNKYLWVPFWSVWRGRLWSLSWKTRHTYDQSVFFSVERCK